MSIREIESILDNFRNAGRDQLIPILQNIQDKVGYLSRDAITLVGERLNLPVSKIYGVATFYNQFRFLARGKHHIQVCRGTACHVKGSAAVLKAIQNELEIMPGETTRDAMFSLEVVACIGACGLAPVIAIDDDFHAKMSPDDVGKILAEYRRKAEPNVK
ncbi:MAG: NADH-quinone oxidoreductase subunit NuoE [Planctomycetes bacterium]|nr:NADH-quinone oxidoreductase subunit NuoE [Planctomycetota bacterium]